MWLIGQSNPDFDENGHALGHNVWLGPMFGSSIPGQTVMQTCQARIASSGNNPALGLAPHSQIAVCMQSGCLCWIPAIGSQTGLRTLDKGQRTGLARGAGRSPTGMSSKEHLERWPSLSSTLDMFTAKDSLLELCLLFFLFISFSRLLNDQTTDSGVDCPSYHQHHHKPQTTPSQCPSGL